MYSIMSAANSDSYIFLLQCEFLLFLFLLWLLWLGLSKLCWIVVVRVGILVLFLILEEMLSIFHHWGKCLLWVCFIMLRYVSSMLAFWGIFIINVCEVLSKAFSAFIEIIIWFLFFSLLIWYHIDWFVNIEESFHPWDKAHLVMMYMIF